MFLNSLTTPLVFCFLSNYFVLLLASFSVESFFNLWVIMEFTAYLIMALMFMLNNTHFNNILNFFVLQSISALLFLLGFYANLYLLLIGAFMLKMAIFPLAFWFYSVAKTATPLFFWLMSVPQKFLPLLLLNKVSASFEEVNPSLFFCVVNLMVAGVLMHYLKSLKSMLILSSISNNSWLVLSLMVSLKACILYLLVYGVSLYFVLSSSEKPDSASFTLVNVLNLSGLPPFPLFWNKLYIMYTVSVTFLTQSTFMFTALLLVVSIGIIFGQLYFFINTLLVKQAL